VTDSEAYSLVWRKSRASEAGNCVEVAFDSESVLIRHSKSPSGPMLSFSHPEWIAFLRGARGGEFDLPETG
jgi:Domain of unknown function (DUF397)